MSNDKHSSYSKLQRIREDLLASCSNCNHTGITTVDDIEQECGCSKKYKSYVQYEFSGIGDDYWDLEEKDWRGDRLAFDSVKEYTTYIDNAYAHGLGVILYDTQNGTGKTFLANLILKKAIEKNYSCKFIVLEEMLNMIKKSFHSIEAEKEFEDDVKNADFLCIDNMGSEYRPSNFGEFCKAQLDLLIRYRDRKQLCTIITTNLMKEEFLNVYASNVFSLLEGKCKRIQVKGVDFRATSKKDNYDALLKGK